MTNLMKRLCASVVLVPLVCWLVLSAPEWLYRLILLGVTSMLLWEWFFLDASAGWMGFMGYSLLAFVVGLCFALLPPLPLVMVLILFWCWQAEMMMLSKNAGITEFRSFSRRVQAAIGLVVIMPWMLILIDFRGMDAAYLMGLLVLVWSADTGGYFVGRFFGKHPIVPLLSPKKTWEGLIGSMLSVMLMYFVLRPFGYFPNLQLWQYPLLCLLTLIAFFGDLFESMVKRSYGKKDSGVLIPGHGGILDRVDSLLLVFPVVYVVVYIMRVVAG